MLDFFDSENLDDASGPDLVFDYAGHHLLVPFLVASHIEFFTAKFAREWQFLSMLSYVISHGEHERCLIRT